MHPEDIEIKQKVQQLRDQIDQADNLDELRGVLIRFIDWVLEKSDSM